MQNSAKHLIAALIGFAVLVATTLIFREWNRDIWATTLAIAYTLGYSAVLSAICIILAVKHKTTRRYFISLSMAMVCQSFAELYIGLHDFLYGINAAAATTLPIPEIAYLGTEVFLAALCARLWYEEIEKTAVNRRKTAAVSTAAVLLIIAIGIIGILGGIPVLSGIPYLVTEAAILCYSARFFFVPKAAAKPFLPLMVTVSVYTLYSTAMTFIIPLLPGAADELGYYLLTSPMMLIVMLFIPALVFAGERIKAAGKSRAAGNGTTGNGASEDAAAKEKTALPETGKKKPVRRFTFSKKNICLVLLFFLFGVLVCLLAGYVNSFIAGVFGISMVDSAIVAAPIAEECLKAVPILLFFLWLRPDLKTMLPAAIAVGAGFALLETIQYAVMGYSAPAEILLRLFSTCIMHATTVSLFAASLWYVTQKGLTPSWFITVMCGFGIIAGGITLHGCFNMLVNSAGVSHYIGFIIPIAVAAVYAVCFCIWNRKMKRAEVKKSEC